MFAQFAEAFLGNLAGQGDIAFRNKLDVLLLDYSPKSLHSVDRYLAFLHKNPLDTASIEYQNVVVWGGAYVGEVIRRNAATEYHWIEYEEYMKDADSNRRNVIPLVLTTHAFLVAASSKYVTMPMNKIARWLDEGESNNVHYYASVDISRKE